MTLYELQRDLNNYYNLKDSLNNLITNYSNNILNLEPAINGMKESFSVDGVSKGSLVLKKKLDNLSEQKDYIKNTIIPAINNEITRLKRKIEEEQMKLT